MTRRYSRPHVYLRLARVSNLPTVWTNVLAGMVVAGAPIEWSPFARITLAVSLLYTAGMFLNDGFDREFDARFSPKRPIPAGEVTAGEVFSIGYGLLAAGLVVLAIGMTAGPALLWGSVLAASIVYYDYRHKRDRFGPVIMAICRGLVYCVAGAATVGITRTLLAAAAVLAAYVLSLTLIAKRTGPAQGPFIALLIAGISLVDASFIALAGQPVLALLAVGGFGLTLVAQRWVSGV